MYYLDSDSSRQRRPGKDSDAQRRKNKDLPKLDNYDRCCTYLRIKHIFLNRCLSVDALNRSFLLITAFIKNLDDTNVTWKANKNKMNSNSVKTTK